MDSNQPNIEELITYSLRGDRFAQKSLFEHFAGRMMSLCHRYAKDKQEAEDILQEGFIKVFKNLKNYKGKGSFEGWIRTIIVNTALNKRSKLSFTREKSVEEAELYEEGYEPSIISKLSADEILKIINKLPEGYKIVFNLYAIEGYSHKDIAELLGIEEGTSRSQLAKARKMLKEKITSLTSIAI